jgi:hypothetical protein
MLYRFATLVLVVGAGCGGSGKAPQDLTPAPPDMTMLVGKLCNDARADVWTLPATPMTKMSKNGAFKVSLMSSTQSPPLIGDLTTWTLQIADASGAMVSDATFSTTCPNGLVRPVCPWMPDHGHGTDAPADVMPASTAGQYTINPLYLFMAGYWTMTATITSGATTDEVMYSVCLSPS